mmetsp:Transcript_3914/g.9378  ORF Transcript_3914/g.9378 Transcript_3914/m.9378 type:complete len:339 (+) Transcript_3914:286-1302(+)
MTFQEGLHVVIHRQLGKPVVGGLSQLQGALLLERGLPAGRGGFGLRHHRRLGHGQAALEGLELSQGLGARHRLCVQLGDKVHHGEEAQRLLRLPGPQVHRQLALLICAHHGNVVPLRQLRLSDLLVERLAARLGLGVEPVIVQLALDPDSIVVELRADWHDHHLARGQPERPLPSVVLHENRRHALNGAQDGPVDHHGSLEAVLQAALPPDHLALGILLLCSLELCSFVLLIHFLHALLPVLQVEADGSIEVQLDRAALMLSLHRILKPDVDLGTVECSVSRVQRPLSARLVQRCLELRLRVVPDLLGSQSLLRPRRQGVARLEPEDLVDKVQEVQSS